MARFLVEMSTDDAKDTELYGVPLDEDGLTTALEAALAGNGAQVQTVWQIGADQQVINVEIGRAR